MSDIIISDTGGRIVGGRLSFGGDATEVSVLRVVEDHLGWTTNGHLYVSVPDGPMRGEYRVGLLLAKAD